MYIGKALVRTVFAALHCHNGTHGDRGQRWNTHYFLPHSDHERVGCLFNGEDTAGTVNFGWIRIENRDWEGGLASWVNLKMN